MPRGSQDGRAPRARFSKRRGYKRPAAEITVREDAPENLRLFVLKKAIEHGLSPDPLREAICDILHVRPDTNNWSEYPNVHNEVESHIYGCEWFYVYDFIEDVYAELSSAKGNSTGPESFAEDLNDFFATEGIGWKLVDGEVQTRGSEAFESAVRNVSDELEMADRPTASREIHEALQDLSRRPAPDLTGAIHHAMGALEAVARDITGDPKATLGEILKKRPELLPKPLDKALSQVWGYASNAARHIREGHDPEREEAELVVGLAATVAAYQNRLSR